MGKPGAYLDHVRVEHSIRPIEESIRDFNEFAIPLSEDDQRVQASRCMECGVAFCQTGISFGRARTSGCPLHNLIPEWNDMLYRGLWDDAAQRLSLTNPFPEFTGRVCPALCEAACNLGRDEEPTSIRDNERAISDHLWAHGGPAKLDPPAPDAPKVAVIGSGPSGLGCTWELARMGIAVTLIEKDDRAGGLLMYGIPNMKLPKEIVSRRVDFMRSCGIEVRCGVDASDPDEAAALLSEYDAVVVAVGARNPRGIAATGADADGVVYAVDFLTSATKSVLDGGDPVISAKDKEVVVIGGGDTGTDCVATSIRQGAKSVHQLEFLGAPPDTRTESNGWPEWPNVKKTDYGQIEATFLQGEDPRTWATDTLEVLSEDGHVTGLRTVALDWSQGKPDHIEGSEKILPAQLVLLACGFLGPVRDVFDALGVTMTDGPRILPQMAEQGKHRAVAAGDTPVFAAGDSRNGSTVVVNALSDGLACAHEVAELLLLG